MYRYNQIVIIEQEASSSVQFIKWNEDV